jgi:hypothetical protein
MSMAQWICDFGRGTNSSPGRVRSNSASLAPHRRYQPRKTGESRIVNPMTIAPKIPSINVFNLLFLIFIPIHLNREGAKGAKLFKVKRDLLPIYVFKISLRAWRLRG